MNKQVVSFLSLFSLVLVLSIYYVMVPVSKEKVDAVDGQISLDQDLTVNDAPNLFFTTLEENRKSRHNEVKNTQMEILANADYSNEEKIEAYSVLHYEELVENTEIELEQSMTELDFNDIFIEKLDNHFYITAYDKTIDDTNDIKKVLSICESFTEYFSVHTENDLAIYQPVINFVSF